MDYGTDPLVSGSYTAEHARAQQTLHPEKSGLLAGLRQRSKWKELSLADLRDKLVTPEMMVASGAKWGALQSKHGAQALIEFGFRWPTMLAAGFRGEHLATLRHDQVMALGLTAPRMMECRMTARHLSALRLTAAQLHELGWDNNFLRAIGIGMVNMTDFGLPLSSWKEVLGVEDFASLGFTTYSECARAGWCAQDIQLALRRAPSTVPVRASRTSRASGKIQFV